MSDSSSPSGGTEFKPFGTVPLILIFNTELKRFEFQCDFDSRHFAKDAGFWWDKKTESWHTADPFMAMKLIHYADPDCRKILARMWNFSSTNFQDSSLTSGALKEQPQGLIIPTPTGYNYREYQKVGIEFICRDDERCSNTLLGDDQGVGKTIQIIGAVNVLSNPAAGKAVKRVLVVCPASIKINWGKELRRWLVSPLSWAIATPKFFPRHHDIVIINYDILHKWIEVIKTIDWDLIAADEIHRCKNPDTIRAKALYSIPGKMKIGSTGTAIVNRPKEIFPILKWLDPAQFPTFTPFGVRYCNGQKLGTSWDFTGNSNLPELQARLRATIMIRRMKSEVLTELPPKVRNIIELPVPRAAADAVKQELAAYQEREPMLQALKTAIREAKQANDTAAYQQAVDALKKAQGQSMGDIATLRKEVALKKVPMVVDYLESLWDDDPTRKIVLWCHHHIIMDTFMDRFSRFTTKVNGEEKMPAYALKFSGNETLQARDQTVERFQNDPRCLLFVGQIQAGGVGITLTASSHAIFAELDWVPGNITQAEDRIHRIGQVDSVLIEHLVLEGSLDCRMASTVVEKQTVIDAALNNPTNHLQQHSMFAGA